MGMIRFNYRSLALGYYVNISVIYPTDELSYVSETDDGPTSLPMPGEKPKLPYRPGMKFQTVYLIHGGGDDDSLTYRYTNAERVAQRNHVMLVTPGIPNSFGVDTAYGVKYQTFLSKELPVVIRSLFASSEKREDNFIMGYAMGGNVALGTALMHPELYSACVDISGGIGMTLNTNTLKTELEGAHFRTHFPLYNATFGEPDHLAGSRFDVGAAAREHMDKRDELSKFFIVCGSKEFIRYRVEDDVDALKTLGYDITYEVAEGYDHDFTLWNEYIEKALDVYLPLKRSPIYPPVCPPESQP